MMKVTAKRRRSKAQIKEDKKKEVKQKHEIDMKLASVSVLEAQLE